MSLEIPHDYLDRILRDQWERAPAALLRLALGDPAVRVTGTLDSQPVLVRRGVDGIALAEDQHGPFVGHVEYETSADAEELGQRVSMYGALLYARTGLPVRSSVLLLEPCESLGEAFEVRHGPELLSLYRFRVLRLYRVPAQALAASFELAVLSPLGAGPSLEALRQARDTILAGAAGPERGDLLTALYIVGGRRFDHGTLTRVLSEEQLMQSATYQHIVEQGFNRGFARGVERGIEQGIERGIEQGIERGIEQGIERGIETGRVEAGRALTARMLRTRFPDAGLDALVARCPAQELEALADQILLSPNAEDLRRWLLARAG